MAQVVARVGPEVVLAGDLMTPAASEWLNKVSPGLEPEQVAELRLKIYQQVIEPTPRNIYWFMLTRAARYPRRICPRSVKR